VIARCLCRTYGYSQAQGADDELLALADQAVEAQPESVDARIAAFLAVRGTNLRRGITELRTAVALDHSNNEAHHYLAHAYALSGRYLEAIRHERIALQHDPFQDVSRTHICRLCHFLKQPERADKELDSLFASGRSASLALMTRGSLAWFRHNWEAALEPLERAAGLDPNNVMIHYYLGDCYARVGKSKEAVSLLQHAITRLPDRYPLHQRLGHILRQSGKSSLATEHFDTARMLLDSTCAESLRHKSAVYQYDMAMLLALRGRIDDSISSLETGKLGGLGHYADLETRPDWEELRGKPNFKALVTSMKEEIAADL
jgi:tetratricopeptide (TPR) repeat protein